MKQVYLDWASAAPVSARAKRAFMDSLQAFGNPSSPHAEGVRAARILEDSRRAIARLIGVKQDSVIFTSGATEANNLAIIGHVMALREKDPQRAIHILYLPTMHASVTETLSALQKWGVQVEPIALKDGAIDLVALAKQVRPETALVSLDVICGETGMRWETRDVRRVLDQARAGEAGARILLHVDVSQAPFVELIEHTHLGADLITLDAQKVGGVRGIGAFVRANVHIPLAPILHGGGQEYGLRPGTEQPALAAAFATALEEANSGREAFVDRALRARSLLLSLLSQSFPDMLINDGKASAPHILNLSFPGCDTDYAVMLLSQKGFAVSTKSACETNEEGSRAVGALFGDADRARSTLRISWGPTTSEKDIERFGRELVQIIQFLIATRLQ
ncbi:MAG: aminotransferase class V-fold PLP-dependent enzyme [Candidatus Pacebacteria bacterium]|nr:aminotransferase class V-fold PLP-dependent enzyme [Candidatus Paceibacterota bacterium]